MTTDRYLLPLLLLADIASITTSYDCLLLLLSPTTYYLLRIIYYVLPTAYYLLVLGTRPDLIIVEVLSFDIRARLSRVLANLPYFHESSKATEVKPKWLCPSATRSARCTFTGFCGSSYFTAHIAQI